ncbi:hypothetical protein DFR31_1985 [Alkalispirillum mobile]|uniref:Uncharacterized protein n=1 Tax=Alkalispirillum mobile TaxID=85925 RepID=A0A498C6Z9_9GAMM|nr:hypothetical protein [Alkalispirillum mobile]RLK48870.1 hypothetical protein DFR31_1985 [Alkalispirillum mobile]
MPLKLQIDALEAELAGVEALLGEASEIGDTVGKLQYQQRADELRAELDRLYTLHSPFASVALYFNGEPVLGSRGIAADFAGRALDTFQEIVSKVYAKCELGTIGERGRVPLQDSAGLMITGVTHGSFGFVLDELSDQEELHDTALKEVIHSVSQLLEDIGADSEQKFESTIEDIDARTLIALRNFFKDMDTASATVRLVDDERDFTLDEGAIHRGRLRTEATQIKEDTQSVEGNLLGFLPEHRRFELQVASGEVVYGTASMEAAEQVQEAVESGNFVVGGANSWCVGNVIVRTVQPLNRTARITYRLVEFTKLGNAG